MPIHLKENPYHGINAHLNSLLQLPYGGWESFHQEHITDLRRAVSQALPVGYRAVPERSLHIRDAEDNGWIGTTYPDVAVLHDNPPTSSGGGSAFATPTLEAPIAALTPLVEPRYTHAIKIYDRMKGQLVTRIELLSPSNKEKPAAYLEMRDLMWRSGVNMVELDYLHGLGNLFQGLLPNYPDQAPHSYPYSISVIHPAQEKINFYCCSVDETLPTVQIPLKGEDYLILDFDAVYQQTLVQGQNLYDPPDYAVPPVRFHTYSPPDQVRIEAVMERIRLTHSEE